MSRGCTCHVGFNWENGPCNYCTDPRCHECAHEQDECPDDCYCDCNDNTEDDEPNERLRITMSVVIEVDKHLADAMPTIDGFVNGDEVITPRAGIEEAAQRLTDNFAQWCLTHWEKDFDAMIDRVNVEITEQHDYDPTF